MESKVPPEPGVALPSHPLPPPDLHRRELPLCERSGPFYRFYQSHYSPVHFGRTGRNRFDAPAGEFGTLYLACDLFCAFVETFGHQTGTRLIAQADLALRSYCEIGTPEVSFGLVDLTAAGLARLGADARLCSGDYAVSQQWALAFWQHPSQPDGILYRSRHDPSRFCLGLFDRPETEALLARAGNITPHGSLTASANVKTVEEVLAHYRFGLA